MAGIMQSAATDSGEDQMPLKHENTYPVMSRFCPDLEIKMGHSGRPVRHTVTLLIDSFTRTIVDFEICDCRESEFPGLSSFQKLNQPFVSERQIVSATTRVLQLRSLPFNL
jgi:hypothetical protein